MKKTLFILLTAVFAWSATAAHAQSPSHISYSEASYLLQKIHGTWHVNKSTWHPEIKMMTDMTGTATHSPSSSGLVVHEQFEFMQPDSTFYKEEGTLRYSKSRHQFEFVREDAATGKEITLYTGHWYSEFKTILLTGVVRLKNRDAELGQRRYIFLKNGTFVKIIHYADKNGNLHLGHRYHYIPSNAATAGLK